MSARNIAFGAIYATFSFLLLAISVSLSSDPFTLMLSSLPVVFILDEFDFKTAFTTYATVLFLVFSFFGLRISVVGFALLFGPYALIRERFLGNRISCMVLRWITLLVLAFVTYSVVSFVLNLNNDYFKLFTVVLVIFSLFMYERLVEFSIILHRRFFRKFSNKER